MDVELRSLRVGVIVLLVALGIAMFRQGGYHQAQHQLFAILVLVSGIGLLASRHRASLIFVGLAVLPLLASSALSTLVSEDRSDAASTFLTIALVAIALAMAKPIPVEHRRIAINGALAVASIVAVTAIWGVATHSGPWGRITEGVWRGSSSLTYANGAAGLVGPCAVVAFWLTSQTQQRFYAATTTLMLIAFASTQSRGGALALALAFIATVMLMDRERFVQTAIPIGVGVGIGSLLLLGFAADTTAPNSPLVIGAVLVGLATTLALFEFRHKVRRAAVLLVGLMVVGVAAVATTSIGERLSIRSGTTAGGQDANALFGDRVQQWAAGWEQFTNAPLLGNGPGVVDLRWTQDGRTFESLFVHNEYLELAVTHGLVGLVALGASTYLLLRRRAHDEWVRPIGLAIGTFMAHSIVDFHWHIPALPVFFAFLAGLALSAEHSANSE